MQRVPGLVGFEEVLSVPLVFDLPDQLLDWQVEWLDPPPQELGIDPPSPN